MSKKVLKFNSFCSALSATIDIIKNRTVDLSTKHILLVPEKDTLKAEQMLFSGGGAFDVEVYSLSRWFWRLGGGDVLPPAGAVMIIKDILYDLKLKCFFRSKGFDGFCKRVYDTFCDLDCAGADLDSLSAGGALGLKLDDLRLIHKEYKKRTEGLHVGKGGKVRLISSALCAMEKLNAHVYTCGFVGLTRAEEELFEVIGDKALSFTRAEVVGRLAITACTEIYKASSAVSSLKAAASRIRHLLKTGADIEKMCMVAPAEIYPQARRILGEYGIPHCVDISTALSACRTAEYLRLLLSLKKLSRRDFILLSKNPLSGIKPGDSDVFEHYCQAFLIDYVGFSRTFTLTDPTKKPALEEHRLQIAERVRAALYARVKTLWDRLENVKTAREFSDVIARTLEEATPAPAAFIQNLTRNSLPNINNSAATFNNTGKENYDGLDSGEINNSKGNFDNGLLHNQNERTTIDLSDTFAAEKEKILGILSAHSRFLCGDGAVDKRRLQFLTDAFLEGISSESLEKLPHTRRSLMVGDAGIFRGGRFSHTFVVGFSEGVLPAPAAVKGLVTAKECEQLKKLGAQLPTEDEASEQNEFELLQLFSASDNLFLSYPQGAEGRPSPLLYEIEREASSIKYSGSDDDLYFLENLRAYGNYSVSMGNNGDKCCAKRGGGDADNSGFCDGETDSCNCEGGDRNCGKSGALTNEKANKKNNDGGNCNDINSGNSDNSSCGGFNNTNSENSFDITREKDRLVLLAGSKSVGLELLILSRNNPTRFTSSLFSVLKKEAQRFLDSGNNNNAQKDGGHIMQNGKCANVVDKERESIKKLFKGRELSASALGTYFSCPYKHFVEKGLRPARQKTGKADYADIGTAVHKVVERFSKCGFDFTLLDGIIGEVLSIGVYQLKQNERLKARLSKEIKTVCVSFAEKLLRGDFKRLGEEIRFGENKPFRGLKLGEATLGGSIDYVDAFGDYVRVIDCKTGGANIDEAGIYYGRTLQLPLYMLVMCENGYKPAAMLYYLFKENWDNTGGFCGIYLADKEILCAIDPFVEGGGREEFNIDPVLPAKIKHEKKGERITGKGSKNAGVIDAYLCYTKEVSTLAASQILDGNIAPSPFMASRFNACTFCDYMSACGFRGRHRVEGSAKITGCDACADIIISEEGDND